MWTSKTVYNSIDNHFPFLKITVSHILIEAEFEVILHCVVCPIIYGFCLPLWLLHCVVCPIIYGFCLPLWLLHCGVTRTPLKPGSYLRCSGKVCNSCSTSGTRGWLQVYHLHFRLNFRITVFSIWKPVQNVFKFTVWLKSVSRFSISLSNLSSEEH
jgi:hypothetical protein